MTKNLTAIQAFSAMKKFLDIYYIKTGSDDLALLLSDAQLHEDGSTWDPAAWEDWIECLEKVTNDIRHITVQQAFEAMKLYLGIYANNTCSQDIPPLLHQLKITPRGTTHNPAYWENWLQCVQWASQQKTFEADSLHPQ